LRRSQELLQSLQQSPARGWVRGCAACDAMALQPAPACRSLQGGEHTFQESIMATQSRSKASRKVGKAMHEYKRGTLKSGRSGKKVTSRKQAVAIGLSEARKQGAKVPPKRKSS